MIIFRGAAIYLAIIGIVATIALMWKITHNIPEPQVIVTPAANPYENAVSASGIIEAVSENISIGIPVSGVVTDLYVEVADKVSKGCPLFKIDDRELQAQLLVQEAHVLIAHETAERIRDQLQRLQSVKDLRAVSIEEVRTKEHDLAVALAQLQAAQAQVKQTHLLLERYTVCAPKDGVILQSNIRPGQFASPEAKDPPMILGDLQKLQIRVDVDEQNASRIKSQTVGFAYPKNNTTMAIPLHFMRIEPFVIPKKSLTGLSDERVDTRVLQVIYTFEKPLDFPIYVGQQVDVFIQTDSPKIKS